MKAMEVYKHNAELMIHAALGGESERVRNIGLRAAEDMKDLADEVTRLRKKLRKKNRKIAELKEKAWMYDELDK